MKINFLLFIFILSLSSIRAQTFSSSCAGNATMETIYKNDAGYQAMVRSNEAGYAFKDSIELDPALTDSILRAFYAIYNVQGQLWRDTIVALFGYSNFSDYNPDSIHGIYHEYIDEQNNNLKSSRRLTVVAYNSISWVNDWVNANYNNTANDSINNLVNRFGLSVQKSAYQFYSNKTVFNVTANRMVNMPAFTKYFLSVPGVADAYGEYLVLKFFGLGVTAKFSDGNIYLTYDLGCGDCPSGCSYGRTWKFKVNLSTDCSVEYLSVSNWGMFMSGLNNINACIGPLLPVQFTNVTAFTKNNYRCVQWQVATEIDVQRYVVERSADGMQYQSIGEVLPKNTGAAQYDFADAELSDGNFYYRVKMISNSGEVKYSAVARLTVNNRSFIRAYPTLVQQNVLMLQFNKVPKGLYHVELLNTSGQSLFSTNVAVIADQQTRSLQLPSLPPQTCVLRVYNSATQMVQKIYITP